MCAAAFDESAPTRAPENGFKVKVNKPYGARASQSAAAAAAVAPATFSIAHERYECLCSVRNTSIADDIH